MRIRLKRFVAGVAALAVSVSMLLSFAGSFSAAETDVKDNIYDYSNLNTITLGEAGYIDIEDDSFVVNLDGVKTDIRFFGVSYSLSKEGLPSDDQQLNTMLNELAYQGFNLIRLTDCYAYFMRSANELDEAKMILLDKFLAGLRDRGMYVEFDMFTPASLGADGIAMLIDDNVIGMVQRFFRRFLDRVNTINEQYYATDTVIAMMKYVSGAEIGWQPTGTDSVAKYSAALQSPFNEWLLTKYKTRVELNNAWKNPDGTAVLGANEDPKTGTVVIGSFATGAELTPPADATGYARTADFYAFLCDYAQQKFDSIIAYCRNLGFRSPIICSDTSTSALSTLLSGLGGATAKNMIFTDGATIESIMQQAVDGVISQKPFVLAFDFSANISAKTDFYTKLIAYSSFQGFDSFILENYSFQGYGATYNVKNDILIWPQTGLMATIFRHRLSKEAINQAEVVFTHNDLAMEKGNYGKMSGLFSMITAVGNSYTATDYSDKTADIVVSSGNSASGNYKLAPNAIIQSYEPYTSPSYNNSKKESWYNSQGLKSAINSYDINGKEVYIGENKAILPTDVISTPEELTEVMLQLGVIDNTVGFIDHTYVSDTDQLQYNVQTNTLIADCNRISIFSGELTGTHETENISISNFNGRGTVIVYAVGEGVSSANAMDFHVFAVDETGGAIRGTVSIKRADTTIEAFGVKDDGTTADNIESSIDKSAELLTVNVDGTKPDYLIKLKDIDVDAALEGYDPEGAYPDRSKIMLIILIPGISVLIIAYIIILYMEKRKVMHEAKLRKATLEKKMKQRSFNIQTFKRAEAKTEEELLGGKVIRMDSGKLYPYEVYDEVEEQNVDPKWRFKVDFTPAPSKRVVRITAEQEKQVLEHNAKIEAAKAEASLPSTNDENKKTKE